MQTQDIPELKKLIKRKWIISILLTLLLFVIYFGFIFLVAFDKSMLMRLICKNVTIGLPAGIGVLIGTWLLTGIYVVWANKKHDIQVEKIKKKIQ
jgi:uncharacterized membrane protein (DUF485 family)